MAKILSVHESVRCSKCEKIGARWKVEGRGVASRTAHLGRIRNRWMKRLQAKGWKYSVLRSEFGAKVRLSFCPDCADNKQCNCAECKRGRNLPAWLPGGAPIEHFVSRTQVVQYVHPKGKREL